MLRLLFVLGMAYVTLCLIAVGVRPAAVAPAPPVVVRHAPPSPPPPRSLTSGQAWFQAMKPYCNALEVETRQRAMPAPRTDEGAAYSAACFAVGGKIEHAHAVIDSMPPASRVYAASIVFNVGHPVADAGDNASAGPIMRLVLDYQPENYMALYHAGMAEWTLGQPTLAKQHLTKFLGLYSQPDYFHSSAIDALRAMGASAAPAP
jgi:hypothetical protein